MNNINNEEPPKDSNENVNSFITEKIKGRPFNKRKLVRRTLVSALTAVIFALVACVSFLLLEPIFSNWLNPEEEPQVVTFPEIVEETLPEDLLTEEEVAAEEEAATEIITRPIEIVNNVELEITDYQSLYSKLYKVYSDFSKSLVTVSGVSSDVDWFNNTYVNQGQTSGLLVYNNGKELLILVNSTVVEKADTIQVEFVDGSVAEAVLKKADPNTGLAIISVEIQSVGNGLLEKINIAELGNSNLASILASPVMAVGRPLGYNNSVVYGMVTSMKNVTQKKDNNYTYMTTDIQGCTNSSGYLIDFEGQVIGVLATEFMDEDLGNVMTAYSISDLKNTIANLSNSKDMPYLGIIGTDVTVEANRDLNVPYGAYVTEIEMSSPAMNAGIQSGDVIVKIEDMEIGNFSAFTSALGECTVGATVEVTVQRLSEDEYRSMTFDVVLDQFY